MKIPFATAIAISALLLPMLATADPGDQPEKKPAPEERDALRESTEKPEDKPRELRDQPRPERKDVLKRRPPAPDTAPNRRDSAPPTPGSDSDSHRNGASQTRPFLGVATSPVPPSVREYLSLDDGFGITVQEIVPESPASKAGIAKNDILVLFGDQRLISPEHLSLLVRSEEPGANVELTVLRKGNEETLSAVLGEKEESFFSPPRVDPGMSGRWPDPRMNPGPGVERDEWRNWMRGQQEHWREHWDHLREKGDRGPGERTSKSDQPDGQGKPPAVSVRPGFPVNVFGTEGVLKIDNQEGEVTIRAEEGKHRIEIRDADGKVIHEGDYDPAKGTESLPKKAQDHLEKMKLDDLEVLTPKAGKEVEKTSEPNSDAEVPSKKGIL